jgi:hypothetical protein
MIDLGPDFERALITAAGLDPNHIDPGSTQITSINSTGQTTVRATIVAAIDSATLNTLIQTYIGQ